TKQETHGRLNDEIHCGVVADMVSGPRVGGRTVDPQISVTYRAAEDLCPIVCISDLSGARRRGYQVPVRGEADIRSQAEVVVIVIRDSFSEDKLEDDIVVLERRKSPCAG